GTTTELNLADYFRANNIKYQEMKFAKMDDVFKAYDGGQCDVLTTDVSRLYALRLRLSKPNDHVILPDVISKEPLAPVVRQKDDDWFLIVKWTFYAMVNAEELGITSQNIDEALKSTKPDVMRFVGTEGTYGEELGLTKDWAARIIRHVGNYGEVYERNVGVDSDLGIPRGLNELWNAGGILYAPPIHEFLPLISPPTSTRRVDRRRVPHAAVFGRNGSGTFLGGIRAGRNMAPHLKTFPEDAPNAQICRVFPVRPFFHDRPHVDGESFSQSRVVHTPWRIL